MAGAVSTPERSLTYSASVGNPGKLLFQLAKLCFVKSSLGACCGQFRWLGSTHLI